MLEHTFVALAASEVAKQFGETFAVQLGTLPREQWQGPVELGYGVHLVFVSDTTEGREWANARRLEAHEKFYQDLLKRYTITIEGPQPTRSVATPRPLLSRGRSSPCSPGAARDCGPAARP